LKNQNRKKRKFTPLNLSVSEQYIQPSSRKGMIIFGCLGGLFFLSHYIYDTAFQKSRFISSGSLSSNHANIEEDCRSCHDPGNAVTNTLCSGCHEKTSELTVYDFSAHYLYRSNDVKRTSVDFAKEHREDEMPCRACHVEHEGNGANITLVSDKKCLVCHEFGTVENHPEFEFRRERVPDDSTLKMTHLRHTVFVLKEKKGLENIDDIFQTLKAETMDMNHFFEEGCLACHEPDADGKNFKSINFDRHCAQCHIKEEAAVMNLPQFNPNLPNNPGVESIEQMKQRGGPGLAWTYATNADVVMVENGEVSKSPIWHRDSWIMENLKQIRSKLYPGNGLFELLDTNGRSSEQRVDSVYSRAIEKLRSYASEFSNRGKMKGELDELNRWLNLAAKKLNTASGRRSVSNFEFPFDKPSSNLTEGQAVGFRQLAMDLTAENGTECRKCHLISDALFEPVQANQKVLVRAEFNHRAHILEKRCTECHTAIPIDEKKLRLAVQSKAEFEKRFPDAFRRDKAATQNLPGLETCQSCHMSGKVSNTCITCHKFHPNKTRRMNLRLFVQG
jgi:hypothetical protein